MNIRNAGLAIWRAYPVRKIVFLGEPAVDTAALTARLRSQGAVMEWKKNP